MPSYEGLSYYDVQKRILSNTHVFKLKTYKYIQCQCHKHLHKPKNLNETSKINLETRSNAHHFNDRSMNSLSLVDNEEFETNFAKSLHF